MKAKAAAERDKKKRRISKPVLVPPIRESELFPPIDYDELRRATLSMIPEFAAHAGSPALHIAIRTPTDSKARSARSLQAGWTEFWDHGRGIAFARRVSGQTQRLIEFGYFGDKHKLTVFADLAERVWRTVVPLSWRRLLPLGNSNGSNSARDDFALALMRQPAQSTDKLPLNWKGEGAYAERVTDMNLGKLLDVVGCLCGTGEREATTIKRILEDFTSKSDYLYLALSDDAFHAAVECLQQLSVFWGHVERGTYSEQPLPPYQIDELDLKYLRLDDAKRDRMAYELLKVKRKSHSEICNDINRTICERGWNTTTLNSSQNLTAAAKRWATKSPEPLSLPEKRKAGCRRSRKRKASI